MKLRLSGRTRKKSFRTRSIPLSWRGMGGDLIQKILSQCPWRKREGLQFTSATQSAGQCPAGAGCVRTDLRFSGGARAGRAFFFIYRHGIDPGRASLHAHPGDGVCLACIACKREPVGWKLSCARGERLQETSVGSRTREKQRPERLAYFGQALLGNSGNEEKLCRPSVIFTTFCFDFAPAYMKMDWDNVGLVCENFDTEVHRILVALDPMMDVFEEAKAHSCELVA